LRHALLPGRTFTAFADGAEQPPAILKFAYCFLYVKTIGFGPSAGYVEPLR
jgi:hypothetical protein